MSTRTAAVLFDNSGHGKSDMYEDTSHHFNAVD